VADDPLQPYSCAERLKALGDPLRLRIISCLRDGPKNVSEISTVLDMAVVTVSHHLGILRVAGLVKNDRDGRFINYRLPAEVFQPSQDASIIDYLDLGCCRLEIPKSDHEQPVNGIVAPNADG
jgi:DNA-binding transcriptional ArsR family regulator